jgi:hypothetical protein
MLPCQVHHGVESDFGDVREVIADAHEGQPAADVGGGDPQNVDLFEDAELLDLGLEIVGRCLTQAVLKFGGDGLPGGRAVEGARVEQLVQQHRVLRQEGGDPGAGVREFHEVAESRRVFQEQGQIAGPAFN